MRIGSRGLSDPVSRLYSARRSAVGAENVSFGNLNACACPRHLPSYPPNAISTPSPPAVSTAHMLMPSPAVDGGGEDVRPGWFRR